MEAVLVRSAVPGGPAERSGPRRRGLPRSAASGRSRRRGARPRRARPRALPGAAGRAPPPVAAPSPGDSCSKHAQRLCSRIMASLSPGPGAGRHPALGLRGRRCGRATRGTACLGPWPGWAARNHATSTPTSSPFGLGRSSPSPVVLLAGPGAGRGTGVTGPGGRPRDRLGGTSCGWRPVEHDPEDRPVRAHLVHHGAVRSRDSRTRGVLDVRGAIAPVVGVGQQTDLRQIVPRGQLTSRRLPTPWTACLTAEGPTDVRPRARTFA